MSDEVCGYTGLPKPPPNHGYKCVLCGAWAGMWHMASCPLRSPSRYATLLSREGEFGTITDVRDVEAMASLRKNCWTIRPHYEDRQIQTHSDGLTVSKMVERNIKT